MSIVGGLRHRLAHQTYVDLPDGAGGVSRTFLTVDQLWGRIEPVSENFGIAQERAEARHLLRITVRAPNTLQPGDRLVAGARVFHVEGVSDPDGRGRFSLCRCREEQP